MKLKTHESCKNSCIILSIWYRINCKKIGLNNFKLKFWVVPLTPLTKTLTCGEMKINWIGNRWVDWGISFWSKFCAVIIASRGLKPGNEIWLFVCCKTVMIYQAFWKTNIFKLLYLNKHLWAAACRNKLAIFHIFQILSSYGHFV